MEEAVGGDWDAPAPPRNGVGEEGESDIFPLPPPLPTFSLPFSRASVEPSGDEAATEESAGGRGAPPPPFAIVVLAFFCVFMPKDCN